MGVNGVFKYLFDLIDRFFLGNALVGSEARFKVTCGFDLSVLIPEVVTRHKAEDILEECLRRNGVLERKIGVESALVEAFLVLWVLENALDLAAVYELALYLSVVHGLDSEEIARQKQRLIDGVVNREAEHSAKL